jgi:hypothetical protein
VINLKSGMANFLLIITSEKKRTSSGLMAAGRARVRGRLGGTPPAVIGGFGKRPPHRLGPGGRRRGKQRPTGLAPEVIGAGIGLMTLGASFHK